MEGDFGKQPEDQRCGTPKLRPSSGGGELSRSASPSVLAPTAYPVSVRQQMARFKQMMEQPSPSGSTDGDNQGPSTPHTMTARQAQRGRISKVHKKNDRGETPLHLAAKKGDVNLCERLIFEGAEVNMPDNAGWTPLHEACSFNKYEACLSLIRHGANVNASSADGDRPIHDAATGNFVKLVWLLLRHGAAKEVLNHKGELPVQLCKKNSVTHRLLLGDSLPPDCPEEEDSSDDEPERPSTGRTSNSAQSTPPLAPSTAPSTPAPTELAPPPSVDQPITIETTGQQSVHDPKVASPVAVSSSSEENVLPRGEGIPTTKPISVIVSEDDEKKTRDDRSSTPLLVIATDEEMRNEEQQPPVSRDDRKCSVDTEPAVGENPLTIDEGEVSPPQAASGEEASSSSSTQEAPKGEDGDEDTKESKSASPENTPYDFVDETEEAMTPLRGRSEERQEGKRGGARNRGGRNRKTGNNLSVPSSGSKQTRVRGRRRGRGTVRGGEREGSHVSNRDVADDVYEFRSSPESDDRLLTRNTGGSAERELSAPPSTKRARLGDSPTGDVDMEEVGDDDEETRHSAVSNSSRKVPPLRISLKNPSEDEGAGEDFPATTATPSTALPSRTQVKNRGTRSGKRHANHEEDSAQRMTRSKVRQSGKVLDDGDHLGRKKNRRMAVAHPTEGAIEEADVETPTNEEAPISVALPLEAFVMETQPTNQHPANKLNSMNSVNGCIEFTQLLNTQFVMQHHLTCERQQWRPPNEYQFSIFNGKYRPDNTKNEEEKRPPVMDPRMMEVWERQERERSNVSAMFDRERCRLQGVIERAFVRRQRYLRNECPTISATSYIKDREACNPLILCEPPRQPFLEPEFFFRQKLNEEADDLFNRHRMKSDCVYAKQRAEWKAEAHSRAARVGINLATDLPHVAFSRATIPDVEFVGDPNAHLAEDARLAEVAATMMDRDPAIIAVDPLS